MVKNYSTRTLHKSILHSAICALAIGYSSSKADDIELAELTNLSLEALFNISVSSASGTEESYKDAPAAMVIVTADDIKKRGYTGVDEIILDLPGFDSSFTNGSSGLLSYQRGYRTPLIQRTLFMINGIVDNHLWTQGAYINKNIPLSGIERIEVLYGPAGAVYGPNAFLGIINIITKNASEDQHNLHGLEVKAQTASHDRKSLDAYAYGRIEEFNYNIAAKIYKADEAGIEDLAPWGFISDQQLSDTSIWGPIVADSQLTYCGESACPHQNGSNPLGSYSDYSDNHSILADFHYRNFTFGLINWKTAQSYGLYYPTDRAQPNTIWNNASKHFYLRHKHELNEQHQIKNHLSYRRSSSYGDWAEASPGSDDITGPNALSWVSLSQWNSVSNSWLFKQDHQYQYAETLQITAGIKFERKELTKAYAVCGYWAGSYCSTIGGEDDGSYIAQSTDSTINIAPKPLSDMPNDNIATTEDKGIYLQGIWSLDDWRINSGIRYDNNSIYGDTVNPRASAVYYYSDQTTLKLLYGTAFQEPSPIQLWGGWNGRTANPNLESEETQNLEFIIMHQQQNWIHDISIFAAKYDNVIKEEAENAGKRHTYGIEYRGNFHFDNFIEGAEEITGYLYYTYTKAYSTVTYDHQNQLWLGQGIQNCQQINQQNLTDQDACQDFNVNLGDIAPHKINLGINLPINDQWQLNLRTNYVAAKTLYLRNALRATERKNASNFVVNATINYQHESFNLAFQIKNLFDRSYYHSGPESASAGDNFNQRSLGWHNSLIPQEKRNFSLTMGIEF